MKRETKDFRVLVTGSRHHSDQVAVFRALDWVYQTALARFGVGQVVVVHGDCSRGADRFADLWVTRRGAAGWMVDREPHRADWDKHGRAAGVIRNAEMVALGADVCLGFYRDGAGNVGTRDCVRRARAAKMPTWVWPTSFRDRPGF